MTLEKLRVLDLFSGNAVVPQVVEMIGTAILESMEKFHDKTSHY
jgi:hypothetical protein